MFSAMVTEVLENSEGVQLYCDPPLCSGEAEQSLNPWSTLTDLLRQTGRGGSRACEESCGSRVSSMGAQAPPL